MTLFSVWFCFLLVLVFLWQMQDGGSGSCHLQRWVEGACWLGLYEMSWWFLGNMLALEWQGYFSMPSPCTTCVMPLLSLGPCYPQMLITSLLSHVHQTALIPSKHVGLSWTNSAAYSWPAVWLKPRQDCQLSLKSVGSCPFISCRIAPF